jgi:hypothetical protein
LPIHVAPQDSAPLAADLARVVDVMEAELERFTVVVLYRISPFLLLLTDSRGVAAQPGRAGTARPRLSPELEAAAQRGVLALGRDVLARMRTRAGLPMELPVDAALIARLWARTGHSLAGLSDAFFLGHELFSERFTDVTEATVEDPTSRWLILRDAHARVAGYTQRVSQLFRAVYEHERSGLLAMRTPPSTATLVNRVLNGDSGDSAQLGYPLGGPHVALIGDSARVLHGLARRTGRELLHVGGHDDVAWGWLGGATRMSDADLAELVAWQRTREGRAGFGEPAIGLEGFRSSHRDAVAAWRIACALDWPAVRFADEALLIAVTRDRHLVRVFIDRYLGGLTEPLQQAARTYIESGQNVASAAARLGRSRRTVERQLRRVEDTLGRPIRDRASELLVAIRAAEVMAAENGRLVPPKRAFRVAV